MATEVIADGLTIAQIRKNMFSVDTYRLSKEGAFNFPMLDDTTVVGLDLHLAFSLDDTVGYVLSKFRQYRQKYDAAAIIDDQKRPIGLIRIANLQKLDSQAKLSELSREVLPYIT